MRSLTLDVKVWEPTILDLFRNLGNLYCNSLWEGLLHLDDDWYDSKDIKHLCLVSQIMHVADVVQFCAFCSEDGTTSSLASISKPFPEDSFTVKEKYILGKVMQCTLYIICFVKGKTKPDLVIYDWASIWRKH